MTRTLPLGWESLALALPVRSLTHRRSVCCAEDAYMVPAPSGGPEVALETSSWLGVTPPFSVAWDF